MSYKSENGFTLMRSDEVITRYVPALRWKGKREIIEILYSFDDDDMEFGSAELIFLPSRVTTIGQQSIALLPDENPEKSYAITGEDVAEMVRLIFFPNGNSFGEDDLEEAVQLFRKRRTEGVELV